uniref:Cilia- and flagella-associated protein 161 n=1 Tax=Knipowitschia caucasica TaxID=637954 RepID=A0AAV2LC50_KNICA
MPLIKTCHAKVGNWYEDRRLEEDTLKEYLEKKERGELTTQKMDFLRQNILKPVSLSVSEDGSVHFGDTVMLLNMGPQKDPTALSINAELSSLSREPSLGIRAPCAVSAGPTPQANTRTAFIITSVDGSCDGTTLLYDQSFALRTIDGFARGLFLNSDTRSFQKCAKKSCLQEVSLETEKTFLSWWKVLHADPKERMEHEGLPVPANAKVLIVNCKTNQALAVLRDYVLRTMYGPEFELTAHTFLDSHKAEEDKNHWWMCTSALGREQARPKGGARPCANSKREALP